MTQFHLEKIKTRSQYTICRYNCGLQEITKKVSSEKKVYTGTGGGSKDFVYILEKRKSEDGKMYEITSKIHTGLRCLRLEVLSGNDIAYLQELGKYDGCISPNETKNFGKIMLRIAKDILEKFEPTVKYIELQDEAHSMCGSGTKFNLSDMLLLTKGYTYYHCLGFSFKTASNKRVFNTNMEIIKNKKWKDIKKLLKNIFAIDMFPDTWSMKKCFLEILKSRCVYLTEHLGDVFAVLGLQKNNGTVYVLDLKK